MDAEYVLKQINQAARFYEELPSLMPDLIKACEEEIHQNAAKAKGGNVLLKRTKAAMKLIDFIGN